MNNTVLATATASLLFGGAVGGGLTRLIVSAQAICPTPVVTILEPTPPPDSGLAKLLVPTPIPSTGYKNY